MAIRDLRASCRGEEQHRRSNAHTRPALVLTALLALLCLRTTARAGISLQAESGNEPEIFGSGMVLQREAVVPVWGTAAASVPIRADLAHPATGQLVQSRATESNTAGRWVVRFDHLPVGGPYELRLFEDDEPVPSVVLTDVLVGDVWLLSGQSNMVLHGPRKGDGDLFPQIRAIKTKRWGQKPSGAAFYFGVRLSLDLGIPIGLVNRAQSGTALGHWLPLEVRDDEDPVARSFFNGCARTPIRYCRSYERNIRPLERPREAGEAPEGMALRGVVWWQGEKGMDRRNTTAYEHLFPAMMRAWRANLGQPRLPFVLHQLPSGSGLRWTDARAKRMPRRVKLQHWQPRQRRMFFRMLGFPSTSLMSSPDLTSGLHPPDYDLYGFRLGDAALGTTYRESSQAAPYPYSGPIYESAELEPGNPGRVRVMFRAPTANGLQVGPEADRHAGVLQGFAVCCNADGKFAFADARIENGDEVVVWDPEVPTPTAVHYSLGRNPRWANLFNGSNRGAVPFSTELSAVASDDPDVDGFWEPGPYTEIP